MKATVITPTRKPYSKPQTLITVYKWMENFERTHRCKPSVEEIAEAHGISTSVTRYYLDRIVEMNMGFQPKLIRKGREISPSRSFILLPLDEADKTIQSYLEKE